MPTLSPPGTRARPSPSQDPWSGNSGACEAQPLPGFDCRTPWFMGPGIHPRLKQPVAVAWFHQRASAETPPSHTTITKTYECRPVWGIKPGGPHVLSGLKPRLAFVFASANQRKKR